MSNARRPPVRGLILVADDSPDVRDVASRVIRKMGYEVVIAVDGEEAISLSRSERPDLILLDIMMPKVHGMDVLKKVMAEPGTCRRA